MTAKGSSVLPFWSWKFTQHCKTITTDYSNPICRRTSVVRTIVFTYFSVGRGTDRSARDESTVEAGLTKLVRVRASPGPSFASSWALRRLRRWCRWCRCRRLSFLPGLRARGGCAFHWYIASFAAGTACHKYCRRCMLLVATVLIYREVLAIRRCALRRYGDKGCRR